MEKMTANEFFDYMFDLTKDEITDMAGKKQQDMVKNAIDGIKSEIEEEEVKHISESVIADLDDEDWEDDDYMDEIKEDYRWSLGGTIFSKLEAQGIIVNG